VGHAAVRRRLARRGSSLRPARLALLRLVCLAALLGWPVARGERHQAPSASAGLSALDGDTLRLPDGRRVRLPGVDTPETGRPFADRATALSAAFVRGRAWTLVPADPGLDHYGRVLADVQVEGRSLSRALVSAGLAWVYEARDPALLEAQVTAVTLGLGIHRRPGPDLDGPLRVARRRFHHTACRAVGEAPTRWPLSWNPGGLFKQGLSPCRRCLPWPPVGADT